MNSKSIREKFKNFLNIFKDTKTQDHDDALDHLIHAKFNEPLLRPQVTNQQQKTTEANTSPELTALYLQISDTIIGKSTPNTAASSISNSNTVVKPDSKVLQHAFDEIEQTIVKSQEDIRKLEELAQADPLMHKNIIDVNAAKTVLRRRQELLESMALMHDIPINRKSLATDSSNILNKRDALLKKTGSSDNSKKSNQSKI